MCNVAHGACRRGALADGYAIGPTEDLIDSPDRTSNGRCMLMELIPIDADEMPAYLAPSLHLSVVLLGCILLLICSGVSRAAADAAAAAAVILLTPQACTSSNALRLQVRTSIRPARSHINLTFTRFHCSWLCQDD